MRSDGSPVYEVMSAESVTGELTTADEGAVRVTLMSEVTVRVPVVFDCELPDVPVTVTVYDPTGVAPTP